MAQPDKKSRDKRPAQGDPRLEPFLDAVADALAASVKKELTGPPPCFPGGLVPLRMWTDCGNGAACCMAKKKKRREAR